MPTFLGATIRHFGFMLKGKAVILWSIFNTLSHNLSAFSLGLAEVETECKQLQIEFHLLKGESQVCIPALIEKLKLDAVVTDFSPLRVPLSWLDNLKKTIPSSVPFCQVLLYIIIPHIMGVPFILHFTFLKVDAHNIVPVWVASEKQEVGKFHILLGWYAIFHQLISIGARTIRKKIHDKLDEFLTEFPPVIIHPHSSKVKAKVLRKEKNLYFMHYSITFFILSQWTGKLQMPI